MNYLVDTNIFFHTIPYDELYSVADICRNSGEYMTITKTILQELTPEFNLEKDKPESMEIHDKVSRFTAPPYSMIKLINIDNYPEAKKELQKIRKRFYSWMTDTAYLHQLLRQGLITRDEIHSPKFRLKDLGECELIALAITEKTYIIVTNDKCRVYKHPEQNIFEPYKEIINKIDGDSFMALTQDKKQK